MGRFALRQSLNLKTVSAGVVAAIFGCTGPALIIIGGATSNGLSYSETISWIFAVYFFSGLLGIFLSIKYRQPIAGAHSIAGAVLVVGSLSFFTINEAVGAYLVAHLLIILLGTSGLIDKVMNWLPVPIVMGMIVGVMIRFATDMITSITISPLLAGGAIIAFLLSMRTKIPPVLSALILSILLAVLTNQFKIESISEGFILPQLIMPVFSLDAIVSIAIPLAILIICTENAQATGVLMAQGYKPPNNAMAIYGSIVGLVGSCFGGHAINIAGPMTAICSDQDVGEKEHRYAAAVVCGGLFSTFGLFATVLVPFIIAMPSVIVSVIAGLAMLGVLINSLKAAFSASHFQMGAFFALIIGMSGISFFNISAPLWAIVGSLMVSFLVEREHFTLGRKEKVN
ncbi:benzoate/H(+) symporter BenE family transporter [Sporosarcina pasteurii]|uniref:Inner membrane protein ydcO n=1 Tax=Sporosarcina pasteurii TaxID=1474 RepID=A0A380C036_SPOPA|nr:benzoate/H(+) symporter BenE family transporter [Sporosarcina pasteurii]MDS9471417.1 benzoate/H(+) symporter BenE family transporter [Sporosarcina pasteurii]QBQ04957.1 benzoate transporter [Sporosarcina pasteurii]SUJ09067.1 Inner membrane protein ydcO [Sporosarcina pasteurii]